MPAKRKSSPYTNYPLIAIGCLMVVLILFAVAKQNTSDRNSMSTPSTAPATQSRTFTSSPTMGSFTITIPEGFEVEEKFGNVFVRKQRDEILIAYSGTNYNSLKDLFNLDPKLKNKTHSYLEINTLEAATLTQEGQKNFYIYNNYALYAISTTDPELYTLLDMIAQSFTLPED